MGSYRFQVASDVSTRDGLAIELVDDSGERLLEVFRDDDNGGELTFSSFGTVSVSFEAAAELIEMARRKFVLPESDMGPGGAPLLGSGGRPKQDTE